jgi:hypothetical protein
MSKHLVTFRFRHCSAWRLEATPAGFQVRLRGLPESPEGNFVSPGTVSNRWLNGHLASLLRVAEKLANDGNTTSSKAARNHIT